MSNLFGDGLFGAPWIGVSVAVTLTTGVLEVLEVIDLSGLSDNALILTTGNLTEVGLPPLGSKNLRTMPWARLSR